MHNQTYFCEGGGGVFLLRLKLKDSCKKTYIGWDHLILTRNTCLAKPREARAGFTIYFYLGCTASDIPNKHFTPL